VSALLWSRSCIRLQSRSVRAR